MMRLSPTLVAFVLAGVPAGARSQDVTPGNDAWVVQECVLKKLPRQLGYTHDADMLPDLAAVRTADIDRLIVSLDIEVKAALLDASQATWKDAVSVDEGRSRESVGAFMDELGRSLETRFDLRTCGSEYLVVGAAALIASQWFYSVVPQSQSLSWNERTDLAYAVVMAAGALQAGHRDAFEQLTMGRRARKAAE